MQSETYVNRIVAKNFFKYNPWGQNASAKRKIAMCIVSLFIGAINGLFGAGGGMLAVPCLTYVWGLDEKSAHATAIAVILPLCLNTEIFKSDIFVLTLIYLIYISLVYALLSILIGIVLYYLVYPFLNGIIENLGRNKQLAVLSVTIALTVVSVILILRG